MMEGEDEISSTIDDNVAESPDINMDIDESISEDIDIDDYFRAEEQAPLDSEEPADDLRSKASTLWAWGFGRLKEEASKLQENPKVKELLEHPSVGLARDAASQSYVVIKEGANVAYERSRPTFEKIYNDAQPTLEELKTASGEIKKSFPTADELRAASVEVKESMPSIEELSEGFVAIKEGVQPVMEDLSQSMGRSWRDSIKPQFESMSKTAFEKASGDKEASSLKKEDVSDFEV